MRASRLSSGARMGRRIKEKSDSRKSPTTVIELGDSSNSGPILIDILPVQHVISPIEFSPHNEYIKKESSERYAKLRRKRLERKNYMNIMPTIFEVSAEEEKEGGNETLGFDISELDDDISLHIGTLSLPSTNTGDEFNEVQLLIDAASQRAAQGNEEKAIEIFQDALQILAQGARSITRQMDVSATNEPNFEKTALYIILHEEWAELALKMASVRSMMAKVHERQEEYDEAICCCEEARAIYQRQSIFDRKHHKRASSAHEEELKMEEMIERFDEARESEPIRKPLHETVERIQEKLMSTEDETSRTFLYEDIFDKLSTVLSLELMYLGETHPQIADTKAIFSFFYTELEQNEKAMATMNDAVLICEIALGDSHPRTGMRYHEAARLFERIGGIENEQKAIDLYEKAIATLGKVEGNVSEILSSVLSEAGALYINQAKYSEATTKLKKAIDINEEQNRSRCDDETTELIQIWLNLADCYSRQSQPQLATDASRKALLIQKKKRKYFETSAKDEKELPSLLHNTAIVETLMNLGSSLSMAFKFDQAYGYFDEALSLLRRDFAAAQEMHGFNPNVDLTKYQDEIASVLYEQAKMKQEDNKLTEASKLYGESLELRKESDKNRDCNERRNQMHCAMCLAGIGSIDLLQKEPANAFKSFNQAIHYVRNEGISDSHPVAKMLWEKSHIAAMDMNKENPRIDTDFNFERTKRTTSKTKAFAELNRAMEAIDAVIDAEKSESDTIRVEKETHGNSDVLKDLERGLQGMDVVIGMQRQDVEIQEPIKKDTELPRHQKICPGHEAKMKENGKQKSRVPVAESDLLKDFDLPPKDKLIRRIDRFRGKLRITRTLAEF